MAPAVHKHTATMQTIFFIFILFYKNTSRGRLPCVGITRFRFSGYNLSLGKSPSTP